jgi:beta-carotene 3-hydroxylase
VTVTAPLLVVASFLGMEAASYALHRWVMHGFGMVWHRSHHRRREGRFEANDLFPLCFSAVGVGLFALATMGPAVGPLLWVAIGVTAYGACYMVIHDVHIHGRLGIRLPQSPYLDWVRESHALHHQYGGEPYGMLLPVVPRSLRARAARTRAARMRL